tara:strand:+ start:451 stop:1101 length:651 start_codon:yes stop_codon:yes gene_type:complete
MRTKTIEIYEFHELDIPVQQSVVDRVEVSTEFIYQEAEATVDAFCKAFNVKTHMNSWLQFACWNPYLDHEYEQEVHELTGMRLRTYLINNYGYILEKGKYYGNLSKTHKNGNPILVSKEHPVGMRHLKRYSKVIFERCCNLTGVCYDISIMKPIYNFIDNPNESDTINVLFDNCFNSLEIDIKDEEDYHHTDDAKAEQVEIDDNEYLKDGTEWINE